MKKCNLLFVLLALLLVMPGCGYLTPQNAGDIQALSSPQQVPATSAETAALDEAAAVPVEAKATAAPLGGQDSEIKAQAYTNTPQKGELLQDGQAITYVGLGYNILESTYINPQGFALGRHILKADEVKNRLQRGDAPTQSSYTILGDTVKTYCEDLTAKLKLKSKYPLFSGSFESEFDKSQTKKSNIYFIKSMSGYPKISEYIDITDDLKNILDPTFEKDLNGGMGPEELYDTYGTHLVVEALMGARCTYNYTYTSTTTLTTTQLQAKVDATYRFISGSTSVDDKKTAAEFLASTTFQSVLSGGKDVDASTLDNLLRNFPAWVESLPGATPTIYGISNMNSLIPIWKFAADAQRAGELETYYNERGGDIQKLIDAMSVIPVPTPAPETYIRSIVITSAKDRATARKVYSGYKLLDDDLNRNAGGDYIYISYNTTDDPAQALTDIRITYDGFSLPSSYTKDPHDLNKNAGGKYIYLWTSTDAANGKPIKVIDAFYGQNADMPTGYTVVNYNNTDEAADLNKDAGGDYIYLGLKR